MTTDPGDLFLQETLSRMHSVKALGEGALDQLDEQLWHATLSGNDNSAAILVQHLHGNMRSRWTGFPDADGESATRDRDREFIDEDLPSEALRALWNDGWSVFLNALAKLTSDDLARTVRIRGEVQTVLAAVQRQVAHYSGHVYQLVYLVKTLRGADWQTLSIPKGASQSFNEAMRAQHTSTPSNAKPSE